MKSEKTNGYKAFEYQPKEYWQQRLARDFSLGGVGYLGLGRILNSYLYRLRVVAVDRAIKRWKIDVRGKSILDVGCGTGFWLEYWSRRGAAELSGVDIAEVAIDRLRQRFPNAKLYCDDISNPSFSLPTCFDIVSAFDVLFHITDDEKWSLALRNIARHLKPGGWLLLTDLFLHGRELAGTHQVSRTLSLYLEQLMSLGFEYLGRLPIFVFAHPPIDEQNKWWRKLLEAFWAFQVKAIYLARRLKIEPFVAHPLGGLIVFADLVATYLCREGPTSELMVVRKVQLL